MQAWRGEARQGIVAAASPAELPVSQVLFFASRQIGGSSQDQWLQLLLLLLRIKTHEDAVGRVGLEGVLRPAGRPSHVAVRTCVFCPPFKFNFTSSF